MIHITTKVPYLHSQYFKVKQETLGDFILTQLEEVQFHSFSQLTKDLHNAKCWSIYFIQIHFFPLQGCPWPFPWRWKKCTHFAVVPPESWFIYKGLLEKHFIRIILHHWPSGLVYKREWPWTFHGISWQARYCPGLWRNITLIIMEVPWYHSYNIKNDNK